MAKPARLRRIRNYGGSRATNKDGPSMYPKKINKKQAFFSMVLLVQAPDLLAMNGRYFYFLGLFKGGGETLFAIHVIMCVSCTLTALLLYLGTRTSSPLLLLPHFIWQCTFIAMSLIISTVLLILGFRGDILLPSSIVLSAMLIVPGKI
ncbi:unnamed protein product [Angiostrongylus costaricensis]|uniref:Cytochrome b561 domain-containing protein n=1 Tax=Angiostrongylus costaricensis TaxID=334426 RepID=A0A0R3PZG3_ANGCS|nr:unnamed protein product [Angiostrongylus costaricensis]